MTDDLVTWLRGCLNDAEAAIIYYRDGHPGQPCTNSITHDPAGRHYDQFGPCLRHVEAAEATPYRDATFGLADIEVMRRLVDLHDTDGGHECVSEMADAYGQVTVHEHDCPTLRLLALRYAHRDGYRGEEWRP